MLVNLTYNDFNGIADFLDMERDQCPPVTDLNVEVLSNGDAMRGLSKQYWDSFTAEERAEMCSHIANRVKSDAERKKISDAHKGREKYYNRVGGALIKDGKVVEFDCIKYFCIEHGLHNGHITQVLNGKRKSHKGWTKWEP